MLTEEMITGDVAMLIQAADRADDLARDGFRVLAVAAADLPGPPPAGEMERGLRLLGLIGILDPPRESAAATIAACQAAGIVPVLITGDHPATARAIAADLGIIGPGEPVVDCRATPGGEADGMARVFARATPEQKLTIIAGRQATGDVVAMTGDGVNDGPALRHADIGVAMGKRRTEVARQAADLVLADDELGTVVAAAEEGRRVYANIRPFLLYALSGGSAEIAVMLAGPFLGLPLPLLPAQILWVNLMTHGLPGVALGSEPADPGAMYRPPRPPAESVLGAGLWQRIARVGVVIAAVTLAVAAWGHATGRPWQSMAFLALGTTQLAVAAGCTGPSRHPGQPGPARRHRRRAGAPGRRALCALPARSAPHPAATRQRLADRLRPVLPRVRRGPPRPHRAPGQATRNSAAPARAGHGVHLTARLDHLDAALSVRLGGLRRAGR